MKKKAEQEALTDDDFLDGNAISYHFTYFRSYSPFYLLLAKSALQLTLDYLPSYHPNQNSLKQPFVTFKLFIIIIISWTLNMHTTSIIVGHLPFRTF